MVLYSGILVKKKSTSRLAIYKLGSCLQISSEKLNDSVTVYSCSVKGVKNGNKNFASLLVGLPIADKILRKGGSPLLVSLCTFSNLTRIKCLA